MRIEYDATLDEIVDTHLRTMGRSKYAVRTRIVSAFTIAGCTAGGIFLYLSFRDTSLAERFLFAGFGATCATAWHWLGYRRSMKRRLRRYRREHFSTDASIRFTVELREECIWTKLGGTQISFDWENVKTLVDSEEGIELCMCDGSVVFIRSRGFPSDEARREFKNLATALMRASSHAGLPFKTHDL